MATASQRFSRSVVLETATVIVAFFAYVAVQTLGLVQFGVALYPLFFLPLLLAAWARGLVVGVVTAIGALPLHVATAFAVGMDPWTLVGTLDYISLTIGYIVVAGATGRLSDVRAQLYDEIERRKETEFKLQQSEERFELFMENIPAQIFINDSDHRALYLNREHHRAYGSENAHGRHISSFLNPEEVRSAESANERALQEGLQVFETNATDRHGRERHYQTYLFPIPRRGKEPLLGGISLDLTDWHKAQLELKAAAEEKELLLREIHHRVRNNLSVIGGIVRLRRSKIEDPILQRICLEIEQRIAAISIVHEKLYRTNDLKAIRFSDYAKELAHYLLPTLLDEPDSVELQVTGTELRFSVETLVPLGIVLTELLTNALKYAFPNSQSGVIRIAATHSNATYSITVADNGVGMPEGFEPQSSSSLGYQLIRALTEQIGGTLTVTHDGGTSVSISFPEIPPE